MSEAVAEASEPLIPGAAVPAAPQPWSHAVRVLFRIAFIYFLLFAFCYGNGTLFQQYGRVGGWIQEKLTWPLSQLSDYVSVHLLHFTGVGATHHPTGSGDTLVQYVQQGVALLLAIVGGLLWSAVSVARGNRRIEYTTAHAWLRFLLRLTCGMFMMGYGLAKVFPLQMQPISTAILNEPVGDMSPMTMLWSLIALNPAYEMVCGAAEVLGGVLILFRRTALAGALLSAFVMTNVLLYNMFFDVPVKLFAANLLLALIFIILPDAPALFRFFWQHQPAAPTGVWVPPISRKSFRWATLAVEWVLVGTFLLWMPFQMRTGWLGYSKQEATHIAVQGGWRVDTPTAALVDPEKQPITELYIDTPTLVRARSTGGELWRAWIALDPKAADTFFLQIYTSGTGGDFHWKLTDPNHLNLTALPPKNAPPGSKPFQPFSVSLTRIPLPTHYPLLERGFHWVNEWGLER